MFWTIDVPINTSLLYSNFDFKIIELDFLRIGDELIMDLFIHDYRYTGCPNLIYPNRQIFRKRYGKICQMERCKEYVFYFGHVMFFLDKNAKNHFHF